MSMINQAKTFFGAPLCLNLDQIAADIALVGVPWGTQGSPLDRGSAAGPQAIREASIYYYAGRPGNQPAVGFYDYDTGTEYLRGVTMVDCGDLPHVSPVVRDPLGNSRIELTVRRILELGAFPVVVGGGDAISAYACKAFDKYQPLDVVHFDAHHDYYDGPNYGWTGALRSIDLECGASVRHLTTIGLRPTVAPHSGRDVYDEMKHRGIQIITAKRFRELGPKAAIALVPKEDTNVYVTLDISVLDASYAPGATAPATGGLTYLELTEALRELATRRKIVGFDLVEVQPQRGPTPLVAGQLILDFLSVLFPSKE